MSTPLALLNVSVSLLPELLAHMPPGVTIEGSSREWSRGFVCLLVTVDDPKLVGEVIECVIEGEAGARGVHLIPTRGRPEQREFGGRDWFSDIPDLDDTKGVGSPDTLRSE